MFKNRKNINLETKHKHETKNLFSVEWQTKKLNIENQTNNIDKAVLWFYSSLDLIIWGKIKENKFVIFGH